MDALFSNMPLTPIQSRWAVYTTEMDGSGVTAFDEIKIRAEDTRMDGCFLLWLDVSSGKYY